MKDGGLFDIVFWLSAVITRAPLGPAHPDLAAILLVQVYLRMTESLSPYFL